MKRIDKKATFGQQASKVTQLADALSQAISRKEFLEGDSLPSINQLSAQYEVSRDTVFKAFLDLRERGLDRKSTRLNSSHPLSSRMPSSA